MCPSATISVNMQKDALFSCLYVSQYDRLDYVNKAGESRESKNKGTDMRQVSKDLIEELRTHNVSALNTLGIVWDDLVDGKISLEYGRKLKASLICKLFLACARSAFEAGLDLEDFGGEPSGDDFEDRYTMGYLSLSLLDPSFRHAAGFELAA